MAAARVGTPAALPVSDRPQGTDGEARGAPPSRAGYPRFLGKFAGGGGGRRRRGTWASPRLAGRPARCPFSPLSPSMPAKHRALTGWAPPGFPLAPQLWGCCCDLGLSLKENSNSKEKNLDSVPGVGVGVGGKGASPAPPNPRPWPPLPWSPARVLHPYPRGLSIPPPPGLSFSFFLAPPTPAAVSPSPLFSGRPVSHRLVSPAWCPLQP